jgi:hypothetical protein
MASGPAGLDDLVKKYYSEGVKIDVEDHTVYIDLYLCFIAISICAPPLISTGRGKPLH